MFHSLRLSSLVAGYRSHIPQFRRLTLQRSTTCWGWFRQDQKGQVSLESVGRDFVGLKERERERLCSIVLPVGLFFVCFFLNLHGHRISTSASWEVNKFIRVFRLVVVTNLQRFRCETFAVVVSFWFCWKLISHHKAMLFIRNKRC